MLHTVKVSSKVENRVFFLKPFMQPLVTSAPYPHLGGWLSYSRDNKLGLDLGPNCLQRLLG